MVLGIGWCLGRSGSYLRIKKHLLLQGLVRLEPEGKKGWS